jgi:hypothetical protein
VNVAVTVEISPAPGMPLRGAVGQVFTITDEHEQLADGEYLVRLVGVGAGGPIVSHDKADGLLALVAKAAAALST